MQVMHYTLNKFRYRKHGLNRFTRFFAGELRKFLKD
jgi:hypothetical protein